MSPFVDNHPGGEEAILKKAGWVGSIKPNPKHFDLFYREGWLRSSETSPPSRFCVGHPPRVVFRFVEEGC